ncbi:putative mediator of RNA polymerase II transcription subunit 26 [Wyeomyia smithii]|uniref:putative mediator of RNA polymerase II transcription subunit 26 n=1 Tax=Wyeomyia smithii TaxID=174621 RepID=UPI0024680CCC|nr:putative mediator of RNA polymerase II transcription subunit 26 [Wyeomyia smithii]
MVQWFDPVLLLATLLVTSGSTAKRDEYDINIKHGSFKIHQKHINARPFKESNREEHGSIGQNNPQIGYKKEVSMSGDSQQWMKGERRPLGKMEIKKVTVIGGSKNGSFNQGSRSGNRAMKGTRQTGGNMGWSYSTTYGADESMTTELPLHKFGSRQMMSSKKVIKPLKRPLKEYNWISTTPGYQNYVTTIMSKEEEVEKEGFIDGLDKIPLRDTSTAIYDKINQQSSGKKTILEDYDLHRTTKATTMATSTEAAKTTTVAPVTPDLLFRNPQLRVPFDSDKTGPVQFPTAKETSSTTLFPCVSTTSTTTTTTTTTPAPTTTTTARNFILSQYAKEEEDKNAVYLLIKYVKPKLPGEKPTAHLVDIFGPPSQTKLNKERGRFRNNFERSDFGFSTNDLLESLRNIHFDSGEKTTTGYAVSEETDDDERLVVTKPPLPVGSSPQSKQKASSTGSNDTRFNQNGPTVGQANTSGLSASFTFQPDRLAQNYVEQQKENERHRQRLSQIVVNDVITTQSSQLPNSPDVSATLPNQIIPLSQPTQAMIQAGFLLPTILWGIAATQQHERQQLQLQQQQQQQQLQQQLLQQQQLQQQQLQQQQLQQQQSQQQQLVKQQQIQQQQIKQQQPEQQQYQQQQPEQPRYQQQQQDQRQFQQQQPEQEQFQQQQPEQQRYQQQQQQPEQLQYQQQKSEPPRYQQHIISDQRQFQQQSQQPRFQQKSEQQQFQQQQPEQQRYQQQQQLEQLQYQQQKPEQARYQQQEQPEQRQFQQQAEQPRFQQKTEQQQYQQQQPEQPRFQQKPEQQQYQQQQPEQPRFQQQQQPEQQRYQQTLPQIQPTVDLFTPRPKAVQTQPPRSSENRYKEQDLSSIHLNHDSINSLEESDANDIGALRDSYGRLLGENARNFDENEPTQRPSTQNIENTNASFEEFDGTTDPLELTEILVRRNGGLTVDQFNKLFRDFLTRELTESDLRNNYETVSTIREKGTDEEQIESNSSQEQQQSEEGVNEISNSYESNDSEQGIKVQINKTPVRFEPIVKIGYGGSKSHQGVYKSPKFYEKFKGTSSQEIQQEQQQQQWASTELSQSTTTGSYTDSPLFGFVASRNTANQQQNLESKQIQDTPPQQQQTLQENNLGTGPNESGHREAGLSYIKFEKFN